MLYRNIAEKRELEHSVRFIFGIGIQQEGVKMDDNLPEKQKKIF